MVSIILKPEQVIKKLFQLFFQQMFQYFHADYTDTAVSDRTDSLTIRTSKIYILAQGIKGFETLILIFWLKTFLSKNNLYTDKRYCRKICLSYKFCLSDCFFESNPKLEKQLAERWVSVRHVLSEVLSLRSICSHENFFHKCSNTVQSSKIVSQNYSLPKFIVII